MKYLKVFLIILILGMAFTGETWATEASLKCSPSTGTYKVGDTFTVSYNLDTRTFPSYGADLELTYDGAIIEPNSTQSTPATSVTNWSSPATNTVNTSSAIISLDYGKTQVAYTGSTSLGSITFKTKAAGQAQINYTFFSQYDDTTPGVAKVWGKKNGVDTTNILTDVNNCLYVVEAEAPTIAPTVPAGGSTPTNAPTSAPSPTISTIPPLGGEKTTISLIVMGILLLGGGIAVPLISKRTY